MAEVVYFIQAASGPIKIGVASNVTHRLSSIQSSTHEELSLLCTLPGSYELEAKLHERFAAARIRGEWFRVEPALALLVKQILSDTLPCWLTGADEAHVPDFCACGWPIEGELTDRAATSCWTCLNEAVPVTSEPDAISQGKTLGLEEQRRLAESNRWKVPVEARDNASIVGESRAREPEAVSPRIGTAS